MSSYMISSDEMAEDRHEAFLLAWDSVWSAYADFDYRWSFHSAVNGLMMVALGWALRFAAYGPNALYPDDGEVW